VSVAFPIRTLNGLVLHGTEPDTGVSWSVQGPASSDWWGSPGSTAGVVQRPRGHGGWSGDGHLRPKHPTIEGIVTAPQPAALDDAIDRLIAAASLGEGVLSIDEGARTRWMRVKREDDVLITRVHPTLARWSIQLVAPDPRKFGTALSDSTSLPSTTGGLTVPFTVPFTIDAVTVTGQVSLVNAGNISGPVRLRIDGPVTGPVVTHVNSGRSLVFSSSIVLGAGEWIDVDMERREVLANGQAGRNGWVTSRGWSSFEPGDNTWSFSAAVHNPASLLTVSATPAWQ